METALKISKTYIKIRYDIGKIFTIEPIPICTYLYSLLLRKTPKSWLS